MQINNIMQRNPLQVVNQAGHPHQVINGLQSVLARDQENGYYFIPGNQQSGKYALAFRAKILSLDEDTSHEPAKKLRTQRKSTSDLPSYDIIVKDPILKVATNNGQAFRIKKQVLVKTSVQELSTPRDLQQDIAPNYGFQKFRIVKPNAPDRVSVQGPGIQKNSTFQHNVFKDENVVQVQVMGLLEATDPIQKQETDTHYSEPKSLVVKIHSRHKELYLGLEYRKSYLNHLLQAELKFMLSASFPRPNISTGQRRVVVDWLTQVHNYLRLDPAGLYLAVRLMDTLVDTAPVLDYSQLQLVGITALWIAAKYLDSTVIPHMEKLLQLTTKKYTKTEIRIMEVTVLKSCRWNLNLGDPMQFVHYYADFINSSQRELVVNTCNYLMDLLLLDSKYAEARPSLLASAAMWTALELLKVPTRGQHLLYSLEHMQDPSQSMWRCLVSASMGTALHNKAFEKFKGRRYKAISVQIDSIVKQSVAEK